MNFKTEKHLKALDLMMLDLQTIHSNIRTEAKSTNCESELNDWKNEIISFLQEKRDVLTK
jgi:hypothetical protein